MRQNLVSPAQRLIFEISLYTGERMGAIVQLRVSDVYGSDGKPLNQITFPSSTRKSTKHGLAETRQVDVHPDLRQHLLTFSPGKSGYLFPNRDRHDSHISYSAVYKYWNKILTSHGFRGFSTHSSRRFVINELRKNGIEIMTIGEVMGMAVNTVRHYTDNDPTACKRAIATLSI
jgi:integrase/recombinase XerD